MTWADALNEPRALVMPRAIPMGYGEQRYDALRHDVRAFDADGRQRRRRREEGPRWRLPAGTTRVTYRVDLRQMEREVRAASDASRVRDGYLGALGYSVFAYVDGYETRPARLRVEGPGGWPVFVDARADVAGHRRAGRRRAPDFYALADSQIVMGPRASSAASPRPPRRSISRPTRKAPSISIAWGASPPPRFSVSPTTSARVPFAHYTCTRNC